jgi:ribosomal protein L11 methyltransferase
MTGMDTTLARLTCDEPTARRIAAYLGESLDPQTVACSAFEMDGGPLNEGPWQVTIHFTSAPDEAAVRALVELAAGTMAAAALAFEPVPAADWVGLSLAGLKPVQAGRFMVHGAHDRAKVAANRIGIEIEAALAFGTGHHGTTRGCLLAIDNLAKRGRARRVLDLGTGSGVLAIAAAKLDAETVVACDIDPQAIASARANARLNRTGGNIKFVRAAGCGNSGIRTRAPYDLILANILLGPLVRMATPLSRLVAPHGRIVLSGLLAKHAHSALAAYRTQGLSLERRILLDGWTTLVMRRGALVAAVSARP